MDCDPSRLCKKICINGYKQLNIYYFLSIPNHQFSQINNYFNKLVFYPFLQTQPHIPSLFLSKPPITKYRRVIIFIYQIRNRLFSMNPNTYSLRSILQSDLDPALCKLMLHQIKSPLLEHSFQLTTDDEYNGGSVSFPNCEDFQQNLEKNGQHHSRTVDGHNHKYNNGRDRSHAKINKRLDQMSMALSEYELSKRQHQPTANNFQQNFPNNKQMDRKYDQHNQNRDNFVPTHQPPQNYRALQPQNSHHPLGFIQNNPMISEQFKNLPNEIVSPLQCNAQLDQVDKNWLEQSLLEKYSRNSLMEGQKKGFGLAQWCGQMMNIKDAYQHEIYFEKDPKYVRKGIFQRQKQRISATDLEQKQKNKNSYFSFKQAVSKLKQIQQEDVASFVLLISHILTITNKIAPHRDNLAKNQSMINKIMLKDNPVDHQMRETISNQNRIINRLKVNKISEVFGKLVHQSPCRKDQFNSFVNDGVETDMCKTLQYFSQIEDQIQNYASQSETVANLHKVYNLLYDDQIKRISQDDNFQPLLTVNGELISPISTLKSWRSDKDRVSQISKSNYENQNVRRERQLGLNKYSLKDKLSQFFYSLKINPDEYKNLADLSYIWSEINKSGGYSPASVSTYKSNKQKFITQLCKNDVVIHGKAKGVTELAIEKKLTQMGYKRNTE